MKLTRICSVAGACDAPAIRVLRAALDVHHPGARLTVAALPGARPALGGIDGVDVLRFRELATRIHPAARLLPVPVAVALAAPLLLERLLADGADGALLLAPDCDVRAPLTAVEAALDRGAVVVVPRVDGRLPDDGARPDAHDLLAAGEVDDELVAVRAGEAAARCLGWWLDQTVRALARPVVEGRLQPSVLRIAERALPDIERVTDPGYGVSAWNLHERALSAGADGAPRAGGRPICLVRFTGFRPDRPWWLSEHASRARVLDDPVLARLCRDRATALIDAGWTPPPRESAVPEGEHAGAGESDALADDARVRRLLPDAADDGEDVGHLCTPAGEAALLAWLGAPAAAGAHAGVNRYTYDLWCTRGDVQTVYPDLDGPDGAGFVAWLWAHGLAEAGLDERLLPSPDASPSAGGLAPEAEGRVVARTAGSVEVLGYLRNNLGLGEAARGYAAALRAAGVPTTTRTVLVDGPVDERGVIARRPPEFAYVDGDPTGDAGADTLVVCVNGPELPSLVAQLGEEVFRGAHVVGQWAWETDVVPPEWESSFALVDELWVPSNYVAGTFAAVTATPVVVVPHPVTAPAEIAEHHGVALPDGDFTFLFAFDLFSTLQRKNPLGVIAAFREAFAPGEGPRLVLKTTNAHFRPERYDRLRHLAGDRPDIAFVDGTLPAPRMAALMAQADCYVSLHRSEGFGLTLAESMILGKPVIATGFGGNLDFMSTENAYLVDSTLTLVGPAGEHYPADGTWAEPSIEHAAHLMRAVWSDRDAARAVGDRARRDIEAQLSLEAVAAVARRALGLDPLPGEAPGAPGAPHAPDAPGEARGRLARTARRALRRDRG